MLQKRRCFKCQGIRHLQADCPNHKAIMYIGDQLIEIDPVKEEPKKSRPEKEDHVVEYIKPDKGELLVIRRSLHVDLKQEEGSKMHSSTRGVLLMASCVL